MEKIPIIALCGFLGSGKTTLLRSWRLEQSLAEAPLIVHDLSDFGLDAEILAGDETTTQIGEIVDGIAALHGHHAREGLQEAIGTTLQELATTTPAPRFVFCESTGAARPWPLIQALTQNSSFHLRHFIVTVDALNLHRDLADGLVLTGEQPPLSDPGLHHAAQVLAEQIAFASIIILTKVDLVPQSAIKTQTAALQRIQPRAAIGLSSQAGISLNQLDSTPAPNIPSLQQFAEDIGIASTGATHGEIDSILIQDKRPFHPQRLHEACQNHLSSGIYRMKGYLWLASRPGHVLLWQQAGSQITLELAGLWKAELINNPDNRLLPEEKEQLEAFLQTKDETFGDRHVELTLIGLPKACEAFADILRDALCTDEEVEAWLDGGTFDDPWPTTLRSVG